MIIKGIKKDFPALKKDWIYLDGPGGTQVCRQAIKAVEQRFRQGVANFNGQFPLSQEMDALSDKCRSYLSMFLGAKNKNEIHFGPNMTTLSFQLADQVSGFWKRGDNIVLTRMDHYANVDPFKRLALKKGVEVRWLSFSKDHTFLSDKYLSQKIDRRTKFIALPAASNAIGSMQNINALIKTARKTDALVHVDAVHLAPHAPINIEELDCDFLSCSAYKFYCPHLGIQYIRHSLDKILKPTKLVTAPEKGPMRYETGTQNQASMSGVIAGLEWISSLSSPHRRVTHHRLKKSMVMIRKHEAELSKEFLGLLEELPQWKCFGPKDHQSRTPTFALVHNSKKSDQCASELGKLGVSSWAGHFYAKDVIRVLGVQKYNGILRIGFSIYHDLSDVKRVIACLSKI